MPIGYFTNEFLIALEELQNDKTNTLLYPTSEKFKTSLYADNYDLIYSTSKNPEKSLTDVSYTSNKVIRYLTNPKEYYLNTHYVVVEIVDDKEWLDDTLREIILYGFAFFVFMVVLGYYLLNLFLKPMRDALHLLNTFIKDTTHELNTPVSTIMTNIELIDKKNISDKYLLKIINRIEIGTKTISNIYDDLTFLILDHKIVSNDQELKLKKIIEQRVEYFLILANTKKIKIETTLDQDATLFIDEKKISKLLDNLLSNAIKYNKLGGSIYIHLEKNKLSIKDTGKGIEKENIDLMFDRYARFDNVAGGFGIGLNIVKMISKEYNLDIKITSELGKWTDVTITW